MKTETLPSILDAAKKEFSEKGFERASLRNIVKSAGVTTGAFYGYFKSKEDLFAALVGEVYDELLGRYRQAHEEYEALPDEERIARMTNFSEKYVFDLFEYAYDHRDEMLLILKCSEGTPYSNLIDEMVEIETAATTRCYDTLEEAGRKVETHNPWIDHILATGTINSAFEVILHDFSKEEMRRYLKLIWDFYSAGWASVLGQ